MRVLKFTLLICTFAGFWQPPSWTSLVKHIIYKTYAMFLTSSLYTFAFSQFMNILTDVDNSDDLVDTLYMMLTVFVAGYKLVCMWIDRKIFTLMINALTEKPFKPSESPETLIQEKFNKMIRISTMRYLILVMSSVIAIALTSVSTELMERKLTYKAWVPFDYSAPVAFFLVYTHQLIGMATSGLVNVAYESLICGLLLQICSQIEILEYRLTKIEHGQGILRDCIRHHNLIYQYAYTANNKFSKIIGLQFTVSMLAVCSNLYRIAMGSDYITFLPLILYTGSMLSQIFIYCWFGNEVKLKSIQLANNIYNMEWTAFSNSNKKSLLIIMKRATAPIEFNSMYILTMNVDSFVGLLKMSYSAFNLLHRNKDS